MYDTPSYQEFLRLEFPSGKIGDTIADSRCGVSTVCQSILEGVFVAKVFEKDEDIMLKLKIFTFEYTVRHSLNDSIRGKRAR